MEEPLASCSHPGREAHEGQGVGKTLVLQVEDKTLDLGA
jgi:hypothetical protein